MSMEVIAPERNLSVRDRARDARIIRARLMNPPPRAPVAVPPPPPLPPLTQEEIDYSRRLRETAFLEAWAKLNDPPEPRKIKRLTVAQIVEAASEHYCVPTIHILCGHRQREYVRPRRIAMYLAREHTDNSYPMIGRRMGGRDHTTCITAHDAIAKLVSDGDQKTLDDLSVLRAMLEIDK